MTKGSSPEQFSPVEVEKRFRAILRGAMHKPTQLKDLPKKRERKPAKGSVSRALRAKAGT